jgi:hypothetical protein
MLGGDASRGDVLGRTAAPAHASANRPTPRSAAGRTGVARPIASRPRMGGGRRGAGMPKGWDLWTGGCAGRSVSPLDVLRPRCDLSSRGVRPLHEIAALVGVTHRTITKIVNVSTGIPLGAGEASPAWRTAKVAWAVPTVGLSSSLKDPAMTTNSPRYPVARRHSFVRVPWVAHTHRGTPISIADVQVVDIAKEHGPRRRRANSNGEANEPPRSRTTNGGRTRSGATRPKTSTEAAQ